MLGLSPVLFDIFEGFSHHHEIGNVKGTNKNNGLRFTTKCLIVCDTY